MHDTEAVFIIGDRPRLIVDSSPDIEILAVIFRE
jgi:hypothetical protein